ncbi:hypothetical protein SAY86_028320 [Trapa natans]|uniref:VOC domain-containing protein n=1 Tax=Trapa natans TaxID=22666 RepID=A0AAN7R8I5_TRANT|nr:hypothetical protein SAY86_028320 [Trapa natans]
MKDNVQNPLRLKSLNHISLVIRSVEESIDFYQNILGFTPVRRPDGFMIEICNCDSLPVIPLAAEMAPSCSLVSLHALQMPIKQVSQQ